MLETGGKWNFPEGLGCYLSLLPLLCWKLAENGTFQKDYNRGQK